MDATDQQFLRETFRVARAAREQGDQPFGALLVSPAREILLEAHDTVLTTQDALAHADINLLRKAGPRFAREFLHGCTLYTSTEPYAMCSGAIFWSGIRRVVFGLGTA